MHEGDGHRLFAFDNSYARLPERFFARLPPTPVAAPRLVRLNENSRASSGSIPFCFLLPRAWRSLRATGYPSWANPSPWPMPGTSSAISSRSSVTDGPYFSARSSIPTAFAATSSSRVRPHAFLPQRRWPRRAWAGPARVHHQRGDGRARDPDHTVARRCHDRRDRPA